MVFVKFRNAELLLVLLNLAVFIAGDEPLEGPTKEPPEAPLNEQPKEISNSPKLPNLSSTAAPLPNATEVIHPAIVTSGEVPKSTTKGLEKAPEVVKEEEVEITAATTTTTTTSATTVRAREQDVKIVGKVPTEETEVEAHYPYMISLLTNKYEHRCGATLIRLNMAISTCSCLFTKSSHNLTKNKLFGVANVSKISSENVGSLLLEKVIDSKAHPLCDFNWHYILGYKYDIGTVQFGKPFKLETTTLAPILTNPTDSVLRKTIDDVMTESRVTYNCFTAGWTCSGSCKMRILTEYRFKLLAENENQGMKAICNEYKQSAALESCLKLNHKDFGLGFAEGSTNNSCKAVSGSPLVCQTLDKSYVMGLATSSSCHFKTFSFVGPMEVYKFLNPTPKIMPRGSDGNILYFSLPLVVFPSFVSII